MGSAIETAGLTKTYGRRPAVSDLSITVEPGEIMAFLGPNGAGKSTTIRLLLGLQRPTRGRSSVLGLDSWSHAVEVHRRVGYLPGELVLFARRTGRQHVQWFSRARGAGAATALAEVVDRLEVVLDRPVGQLSRGNQQKVGLTLALMHRPEVLFLDEPSSGLDPLAREALHRLLLEWSSEGMTVFLSSHELDQVQRLADRVAIIRGGVLVATDSLQRLQANAPRTVDVVFRRPVDVSRLRRLRAVRHVRADGARVTLEVHGGMGPLLKVLADMGAVDVVTGQVDLDEVFFTHYRDEHDGPR